MTLTEATIRKAEPKDKRYRMFDGNGLYLEVAPSGGKWWRLKYIYGGKDRRLSLGVYPEINLKAARDLRDAKRVLLARGEDPAEERRAIARMVQDKVDHAFEVVAMEWHVKKKPGWTERHAEVVAHRMRSYLFPDLGSRPVNEITPPELLKTIRTIEQRGATYLASTMTQIAGQIFRYGIATGRCTYDPAPGIRGALMTHIEKHQNAVKPSEFPKLMADIAGYGIDQKGEESTRLGLQLLALTFVRTSELIEATWDEFDFQQSIWRIDAPRMKMKRDHWVPLAPQALSALHRLKEISRGSRYILPGKNIHAHMSNNTLLYALYRLGYKSRMSGHGFRSVASTILNENGFKPDVIEKQLAHEDNNEVRAAYNRAEYLSERAKMMLWWGAYLEPMLKPPSWQ